MTSQNAKKQAENILKNKEKMRKQMLQELEDYEKLQKS